MQRKSEKGLERLVTTEKLPAVVYGLRGIMDLFGVSKATAFKLRHTVLDGACTQNGRLIIVDVRKALTLFGERGSRRRNTAADNKKTE